MSWITDALLAAVCGGLVAIFGKIGVQGVDSITATMVRSLIMAATLVVVALFNGKMSFAGISGRTLLFIVLAGLSGAASWVFYFRALQSGPVSRIAPIDRLSVVVAIVLSIVLLGERPSAVALAGAALVVAGTLVLVFAP
ncbi:MAG: EamA family transporter [Firmicutes bacterium]|jgi:transporter family protein|nr:EamA family transporter [Bacillota bacterium]